MLSQQRLQTHLLVQRLIITKGNFVDLPLIQCNVVDILRQALSITRNRILGILYSIVQEFSIQCESSLHYLVHDLVMDIDNAILRAKLAKLLTIQNSMRAHDFHVLFLRALQHRSQILSHYFTCNFTILLKKNFFCLLDTIQVSCYQWIRIKLISVMLHVHDLFYHSEIDIHASLQKYQTIGGGRGRQKSEYTYSDLKEYLSNTNMPDDLVLNSKYIFHHLECITNGNISSKI